MNTLLLSGLLLISCNKTNLTIKHKPTFATSPISITAEQEKLNESLHEDIYGADVAKIKGILDKGADINSVDKNGDTILIMASKLGQKEMVECLLARGANVNIPDKNGRTALYWAANTRNPKIVTLLLDKGADINAQNEAGETALYAAVRAKDLEVITLLLNQMANANLADKKGLTPLDKALEGGSKKIIVDLVSHSIKLGLLLLPKNIISSLNKAKISLDDFVYNLYSTLNIENLSDLEGRKLLINLLLSVRDYLRTEDGKGNKNELDDEQRMFLQRFIMPINKRSLLGFAYNPELSAERNRDINKKIVIPTILHIFDGNITSDLLIDYLRPLGFIE